MGITTTTRIGAFVAGGAAAAGATFIASREAGTGDAPIARQLAAPLSAGALGVAALALGAGRGGVGAGALRAAGLGLALGAAGAALLTRSSAAPAPTPPIPVPAPAPTNPRSAPTRSPVPERVPAEPAEPAPRPAKPDPEPAKPEPVEPKPTPEQPAPTPAETASPAPAPVQLLKVGSKGPAVAALQARLGELGYAVDNGGTYTDVTRDAVMAFQKINGLARDGVAGPQTQGALEDPREPQLGSGLPDRVDIDLSSQTMVVVRGGKVAYIVNATSGDPNHPDGKGIATPIGTFEVERKIEGTRYAPLGELYYPSYFRGGVAVHGSYSIVAERASHGCVRVPRWIEQRVFADMPVGSQVVVHD